MERPLADLTQEFVKELFIHSDDGVLRRNKRTSNRIMVGAQAGSLKPSGYIQVRVFGKMVLAHRLVWLYHYGYMPSEQIDHINGIRHDNRISNLRLATNKQNCQNTKQARVNNKSGFLGVSPSGDKFISTIQKNGKQLYLGTFETKEEAHEAYLNEKRKLHEFCTI